jgi:hypothetical protein
MLSGYFSGQLSASGADSASYAVLPGRGPVPCPGPGPNRNGAPHRFFCPAQAPGP